MSVRISRQHWDGLLNELDQARRQRHLLTYRALLERLQFPTPAMQTLTAALKGKWYRRYGLACDQGVLAQEGEAGVFGGLGHGELLIVVLKRTRPRRSGALQPS